MIDQHIPTPASQPASAGCLSVSQSVLGVSLSLSVWVVLTCEKGRSKSWVPRRYHTLSGPRPHS